MSNTIVRTNVMSLNSHRNLGLVGNQQSRASQRLSSGFRINSAADDAAGLGISEKMRSQIRGLDQASRNGQDGISLIQTAEGAMSTINEMVTRVRELVVQAANDTNAHDLSSEATWSQSDRTRIQAEINQLLDEIDATRNRVEFNTRSLIDGSLGSGGVGARRLSGEMLLLAEAFERANQASVDAVHDNRADIETMQRYMNDIVSYQAEVAELLAFVGDTDNQAGGGLRNAIGQALTLAAAEWTRQVDANIQTVTTEASQSAWLVANLNSFLHQVDGGRFSEVNLTNIAAELDANAIEAAGGLSNNTANIVSLRDALADAVATQNAFVLALAPTPPPQINDSLIVNTHTRSVALTAAATLGDLTTLRDAFATEYTNIGATINTASTAVGTAIDALATQLTTNDQWEALNERFGGDVEALLVALQGAGVGDGTPLWFQIGANANQGVHLSIEDVGVDALSRVGTESGAVLDAIRLAFDREGNQLDLGGMSMQAFADQFTFDNLRSFMDGDTYATSTAYGATGGVLRASGEEINLFITAIDLALSHVTDQRSNLGAMQNRLEFTIENLDIASENLSAAESRIRDADMAREMMRLTQANVLQQAAISMLAQANQAPQSVLQLLG